MTQYVDIQYIRNALGITGTKESCKGCRYDGGYAFCATNLAPPFSYVCEVLDDAPIVDAVPSQLTKEEIKTIRIHINAFKEILCNQLRYKEAEDYQQIVDKLDTMMDAERKEE